MRRSAGVLGVVELMAAATLVAQSAVRPTFEVASIKLSKDCDAGPVAGSRPPAGRLNEKCMPVESFIQSAYVWFANGRMNSSRTAPLEGAPGWVSSDLYEINAKAEGSPRQEMLRGPMLQVFLEDRFKLKLHRESRETAVYALTLAKSGPKLKPFREGSCIPLDVNDIGPRAQGQPPRCRSGFRPDGLTGNTTLQAQAMSLDEFSKFLGIALDRRVIDKTSMQGIFDFRIEFMPDESTPMLFGRGYVGSPGGLSIFSAIQEQLGLKLEKDKGPVEFLVIDHIERPSEN
jgi:uncharacterized protein (TIGR03435 family)